MTIHLVDVELSHGNYTFKRLVELVVGWRCIISPKFFFCPHNHKKTCFYLQFIQQLLHSCVTAALLITFDLNKLQQTSTSSVYKTRHKLRNFEKKAPESCCEVIVILFCQSINSGTNVIYRGFNDTAFVADALQLLVAILE